MKVWTAYLAWIDRDLGEDSLMVSGFSSVAPMIPIFLSLIYGEIFRTDDKPSTTEIFLFITPTAFLYIIWIWRVRIAYVREARKRRK